jgi:hypothetical protein
MRRLLPNDPEGIPKAYVNIGGASTYVLDETGLSRIVNDIYDYEDEKYKRTRKGKGRSYTAEALAELTRAVSFEKWQRQKDPNRVMQARDSWTNSMNKMRVEPDAAGAKLVFPSTKSGWYPSFADLFRIFRVWPSPEGVEGIVRGYGRVMFP